MEQPDCDLGSTAAAQGKTDARAGKPEEQVWDEWSELVNICPAELERGLETDEGREVGDRSEGKSTGHRSGRRIVALRRMTKDDLDPDDWDYMP